MEGFAGRGDCECHTVFKKDVAEFGNGWGAVHVRHGVVDCANCGSCVDSGIVVDCGDFLQAVAC